MRYPIEVCKMVFVADWNLFVSSERPRTHDDVADTKITTLTHTKCILWCVWRHDYVTHEKRQKCWSRRRWQPEEPLGDQWRNRTLRTHRFRLANTLQHHTHSWCDKRKGKMWEVTFSAHGDRVERLKSWTVNDGWHIERPKLVGVAIVDVKRYCRRQQQR